MANRKSCAISAAIRSGKFIKSHLGRSRIVGFKGDINLVTDCDKKAERQIIRDLKKAYPDFDFLAEEGGGSKTGSKNRWIIDPIDGTTNFAHGFPFFCVSIALEISKKPVLGVVYDPIREELFVAERGKGAYLNGSPINVSQTKELKNSLLSTGFAYDFKDAKRSNIENFIQFMLRSRAIRRAGSAALDLCYVACGRFDGFWELGLHPWDTAAASLIVTEAGGKVTRLNGLAYSHYDKEIIASNGRIHRSMVNVCREAKEFRVVLKKGVR
jgi:myo-inositol-1(or 4)-monophosphatase